MGDGGAVQPLVALGALEFAERGADIVRQVHGEAGVAPLRPFAGGAGFDHHDLVLRTAFGEATRRGEAGEPGADNGPVDGNLARQQRLWASPRRTPSAGPNRGDRS